MANQSKYFTARDIAMMRLYSKFLEELIAGSWDIRSYYREISQLYVGNLLSSKMYEVLGQTITKRDFDNRGKSMPVESKVKKKLETINFLVIKFLPLGEKLQKPVLINDIKKYGDRVAYDLSDKHKFKLPSAIKPIPLIDDYKNHFNNFQFTKDFLKHIKAQV